jgi:hypothetical protein
MLGSNQGVSSLTEQYTCVIIGTAVRKERPMSKDELESIRLQIVAVYKLMHDHGPVCPGEGCTTCKAIDRQLDRLYSEHEKEKKNVDSSE